MKKTILHQNHIELGARMGEFGGWDMPIQYQGILKEHYHTRNIVSLFDICHMGEFQISGSTAVEDLERLLTCSISNMEIGQVRYGYLLNHSGGVLDDLTVYRLDNYIFLLVVNAGTADQDREWIKDQLQSKSFFEDKSDYFAKLDLQGPASLSVLNDVYGSDFSDLQYFRFKSTGETLLSRTGYTGELGYELYLPEKEAVNTWESFLSHPCCQPAGLGARDTLRLEMGYPLYGHELNNENSPVVMSDGHFINFNKIFIGKEKCELDLSNDSSRIVGLRLNSKRAARENDVVYIQDKIMGYITSGSVSPSLDIAVAMALLKKPACEVGTKVKVKIREKYQEATVVELPFYTDGSARKKI